MRRWSGPASVTLYCRNLRKDLDAIEPFRDRTDFHLVLADFHKGRLYPVNTLRDVAIDNCRTNWMLLVDADFVPNVGLYEYLLPFLPGWEKGENAGASLHSNSGADFGKDAPLLTHLCSLRVAGLPVATAQCTGSAKQGGVAGHGRQGEPGAPGGGPRHRAQVHGLPAVADGDGAVRSPVPDALRALLRDQQAGAALRHELRRLRQRQDGALPRDLRGQDEVPGPPQRLPLPRLPPPRRVDQLRPAVAAAFENRNLALPRRHAGALQSFDGEQF